MDRQKFHSAASFSLKQISFNPAVDVDTRYRYNPYALAVELGKDNEWYLQEARTQQEIRRVPGRQYGLIFIKYLCRTGQYFTADTFLVFAETVRHPSLQETQKGAL